MLDYDRRCAIPEVDFESSYQKLLRKVWLVGSMTMFSFFLGLNNFTSEDNAIWFQRSGSLIVAFSVLSEYSYMRLRWMVTEQLINYGDLGIMTRLERFKRKNLPLEYSDPTFRILIEPLIIFSGLSGTVIWGYGDIIYRALT